MTKLERLLEIAGKATPGKWTYVPDNEADDWQLHNEKYTYIKQDDSGVPISPEDGQHIATFCPQLVQALIREVMAARELRDNSWTTELVWWDNYDKARAETDKLLEGV